MYGHYYSGYHAILGLIGLLVMSDTGWEKLVSWLGKHAETLTNISCEQVQQQIIDRGDIRTQSDSWFLLNLRLPF